MNPGTASPTRAPAQARPAAASGARLAAPGEARIQQPRPDRAARTRRREAWSAADLPV